MYRKVANASIRNMRASDDNFQQEPYTGIVSTVQATTNSIGIFQFIDDKQVGGLIIPLERLEACLQTFWQTALDYEAGVILAAAEEDENSEEGEADSE